MTPQETIAKHLLSKGWKPTNDGFDDYKHPKAKGTWLFPHADALVITVHTVDPHYMQRVIPYADPELFTIIDSLTGK